MTKKAAPPVWQLPALIGAAIVGVGALGTGVVKLAKFITVTDRVEAQEKKNDEQDQVLTKLQAIEDTNSKLLTVMVQQQQAPNQAAPQPWTFLREEGDYQIFLNPEDQLPYCCNGTTCVPLKKKHC